MGILSWIVLGLIVGVVAKLIMPGKDPGGIMITIVLGIAGALLGGVTGATVGSLADAGIEEDFVREVGSALEPCTSALFVLVEKSQGERGIATLKKHGGKVLETSLPEWKEEKLRNLLGS